MNVQNTKLLYNLSNDITVCAKPTATFKKFVNLCLISEKGRFYQLSDEFDSSWGKLQSNVIPFRN